MCGICGCEQQTITGRHFHDAGDHDHHHHDDEHSHHDHHHDHGDHDTRVQHLKVEQAILSRNNHLAEHNRRHFAQMRILALNLVSSPGAGKTSVIERTVKALRAQLPIYVIEGDQATSADAERVRAAGAQAFQINTGSGCHLDAEMIWRAIGELSPATGSLLLIENVGNLVCPAMFDLGEHCKVVVTSTPEGDDKPLKYPHMFRAAQLMLLNKIDLLKFVSFDRSQCLAHARRVNPAISSIALSATTGEGFEHWLDWLRSHHQQ